VGEFSLMQGGEGEGVTRGLHVGFAARSRARVDAFWRAGIEAGYRDDGAPGPRPEYVLDPDGNNVEVVHHERDG